MHFYGIYSVGARGDLGLLSAGIGSGISVSFDRFFVNMDVIAYNVARREDYLTDNTLLHVQSRLYGGVRIMEHLSIFAGISYNYATPVGNSNEEVSILKTVHGRDYKYNDDNVHWPGFFVGVRM
jgi:hypothetical protein